MASSVENTAFDRRHCQAKPLSDFGVRQPSQFAKQSNGTQAFPKPRDGLDYNSATFFFGEGLFRSRAAVGEVDGRSRVEVTVIGFNRNGYAPAPQHHQRFIDRYAGHPS